ncbi:outer membrane beta-barrel protein [Helicobacter cetorum]|uniref:outer membrane beta-barrel protein n=1 Tax=Helicobacter cetorum TaxID=138563 RepID=UPI000CF0402E|nr:outer membrane beta-barrel protein [Helicobacter cetorum]
MKVQAMIFNKKILKASLVLSVLLGGKEVLVAKDCSTIFCDKASKNTKPILFKPKSFLMFDSNNQFATSTPLDNLNGKSVNYAGKTFSNSVNLSDGTIGSSSANYAGVTFNGTNNQFKDIIFNDGGGITFGTSKSQNTFNGVVFNNINVAGSPTFNGTNTFTNGVTFNSGSIDGSITFNDGKSVFNTDTTFSKITLNNYNNSTLTFNGINNQFNNTIFSNGQYHAYYNYDSSHNFITFGTSKSYNTFNDVTFYNYEYYGSSILTFNGTNTFTNGVTFNGGSSTFNNSITFNGSTKNTITNQGNSILTFKGTNNQFNNATFNNGLQTGSPNNSITFGTLKSQNTFNDITFNNASSGNNCYNSSGNTIACNTLTFNGTNTFTNGVTFNGGSSTFNGNVTFNNVIQNAINAYNGSTLTFKGVNNQFNNVTFNNGKQNSYYNNSIIFGTSKSQNTFNDVVFNNASGSNNCKDSNGYTIACKNTLTFNGTNTFTNGVTFNGGSSTFNNSITFNGSTKNTINNYGGSSLTFSGANNQFDNTTFNNGKQNSHHNNSITFGTLDSQNTFNDITFNNASSGNNCYNSSGNTIACNTLTFNGTNTFTNGVTFNGGSNIFNGYVVFNNATLSGSGNFSFNNGTIIFQGIDTLNSSNSPFVNQNNGNQNTDDITFAGNSALSLNYTLAENKTYSIIDTNGTIIFNNLSDLYKLIEVDGIKGSLDKIVSNTINNNARLAQANLINKTYDVVYDDINGKDIILQETFTNNSISVKEIASFSSKQTDTKIYKEDYSSAQADLKTANTDIQANTTAQKDDKTLAQNSSSVANDLQNLNTDAKNITNAKNTLQQDLNNEQKAEGTGNFRESHNKVIADKQNLANAEKQFTTDDKILTSGIVDSNNKVLASDTKNAKSELNIANRDIQTNTTAQKDDKTLAQNSSSVANDLQNLSKDASVISQDESVVSMGLVKELQDVSNAKAFANEQAQTTKNLQNLANAEQAFSNEQNTLQNDVKIAQEEQKAKEKEQALKKANTQIYNQDSSSAKSELNTANTDIQANTTAQANDESIAQNSSSVAKDLKQLNTDSQNITKAQQALQQDLSNEQQAIGKSNFDTYHNKIASDEQNLANAEQAFTNEQTTLQNDVKIAQEEQKAKEQKDNPNQTQNTPTKVTIDGLTPITIDLTPTTFAINKTEPSLIHMQDNLKILQSALKGIHNLYDNSLVSSLQNAFNAVNEITSELNNNSKVSLTSLNSQMSNANEALSILATQIQNSIDSSLSNGNENKENLKLLANTLSVIQNASKVVHQAQTNVSQVATSSITYTQPITQTQRANSSAYGLDIQIGYKYFFGKKKHFGIRGYATYSYMYSSANTAISNKDNNLGKTNHHTYGAGFDFLYNFYESKNGIYTTGILLGIELLGSTWDNSNYALLNDYVKDIKALGGKAHIHMSNFQLPLIIGFRSNFSKHSGIELGFKIPLITNDYFTSSLKGYKETIIYRDNVNLYFNYVVNF